MLPAGPTIERIVRVALLGAFLWMAARHWHPYYGFTRFLQIDAWMAESAIPAAHDPRIYHHADHGSYDGGYYSQIATDPTLRDPALRTAVDDLGYRARRILLSAVAWVLGGGDPVGVMRAYASLNLGLWFGLAALLWRVFPVGQDRGTLAWFAVLFSAGVLFSVRLALTDLTALLLVAAATWSVERGRPALAAALGGFAGLARETAVLVATALLPDSWRNLQPRALGLVALRLAAVILPLALWLLYVRHAVGGSGTGQRNLSWPGDGWSHRWMELWDSPEWPGNPRLQIACLLEHVALTVQILYFVRRPRRDCPWWRVGMAYAVLCLCLGGAVWGGFPNAASRVLLPLTLVFNLRAVRDRANLAWFLFGNLSVVAGFFALRDPVGMAHDLPAGSTWQSRHALETDSRWSVAEWNSKHRWAWCGDAGGLTFLAGPDRATVRLELQFRGLTPRTIEVWHAGSVVWRGPIGDRPQWITLPELPLQAGRLDLEVRSDTVATAEGENNTARQVGIACFGARLAE